MRLPKQLAVDMARTRLSPACHWCSFNSRSFTLTTLLAQQDLFQLAFIVPTIGQKIVARWQSSILHSFFISPLS